MAKAYKAKPASYYFREVTKPAGDRTWQCTKMEGRDGGDGNALDTYTLRAERSGAALCDCPASFRGREGGKQACKHVGWLSRWRNLYSSNILQPDEIVYYDSGIEKFRRVVGLSEVEPY